MVSGDTLAAAAESLQAKPCASRRTSDRSAGVRFVPSRKRAVNGARISTSICGIGTSPASAARPLHGWTTPRPPGPPSGQPLGGGVTLGTARQDTTPHLARAGRVGRLRTTGKPKEQGTMDSTTPKPNTDLIRRALVPRPGEF